MKPAIFLILVFTVQEAVQPSAATWTTTNRFSRKCRLLSLKVGRTAAIRRLPTKYPVVRNPPYNIAGSQQQQLEPVRLSFRVPNNQQELYPPRGLSPRSYWSRSYGQGKWQRKTLWRKCCHRFPGLKGCTTTVVTAPTTTVTAARTEESPTTVQPMSTVKQTSTMKPATTMTSTPTTKPTTTEPTTTVKPTTTLGTTSRPTTLFLPTREPL